MLLRLLKNHRILDNPLTGGKWAQNGLAEETLGLQPRSFPAAERPEEE